MRPACLAGGGAHVKTTVAQDDGACSRRCDGRGTQCAENCRRPADSAGKRNKAAHPNRDGRIQPTAEPKAMDLSEFTEALKAGAVDGQENPFANTVTYGVHKFHRFHTVTNQHYQSRQVFVHRPSFDAWPRQLQEEMRAAVKDAVSFQRELHVKEENDAMAAIRMEGGEILQLTAQEREAFVLAVSPIYGEFCQTKDSASQMYGNRTYQASGRSSKAMRAF
jgi:Bacterial extracellular solute-binding protein, family 7